MSINIEMTALADAIRAKAGTTEALTIAGMTSAVGSIQAGGSGGYDTSSVTATADTMLKDVIAIGTQGETITGNIATVAPSLSGNVFTVSKGFVAADTELAVAEATVTETESKVTISAGYVASELSYELGSGGSTADLSFITAAAGDIRAGKIGADTSGNPVTGTLNVEGGGTDGSSPIFRCTRVALSNDIIVTGGVLCSTGQSTGNFYPLYSYSLVGEYFIEDSAAEGRDRVWICPATVPQTIDGIKYESICLKIFYDTEHIGEVTSKQPQGSWRIVHALTGQWVACVTTDELIDSPLDVTEWEPSCEHYYLPKPSLDGVDEYLVKSWLVAPKMELRNSDIVTWSGEGVSFADGEWSSNGTVINNVTAEGYTPEIGSFYTADTGAYATLFPAEIPGIVIDNGVQVAKITEFTPYSPAFSGTVEVRISGLGFVGYVDEESGEQVDGTDYSAANGKYIVTDDTYYSEEKFRIYKHETKNYWLKYYDDSEYEMYGENYWMIVESTDASDPYEAIAYSPGDYVLADGTANWYNSNWDMEVPDVSISIANKSEEEQPLVLKGTFAESFSNENMEWTFSTSASEFLGYDITPAAGQLFFANNRRLISMPLGYDPADMQTNALAYAAPGVDKSPLQGLNVQYLVQTTLDGVPCVYFDWELPGTFIDKEKESVVYMPLSKTIVANNGFTLMGTMYCAEFSSYGRIMSLAQKIVPSDGVTQVSGGVTPDKEDGSLIGLWFCGTHGFQIQYNTDSDGYMGNLSYAADYKTSKDTYHGKWVQFALMLKDYTMYVWLNGEVKIICPWGYEHLDLTFNYLSFKDAAGAGIHFGPMFAFDRALYPNEIFYQLNKLNKQISE